MRIDWPPITCPHCGHKSRQKPAFMEVAACDVDEGGCDEHFVYTATPITTYKVNTFTLTPATTKGN